MQSFLHVYAIHDLELTLPCVEALVWSLQRLPVEEPKKPRSAYLLFANEKGMELTHNSPERSRIDIMKELGTLWTKIDPAEKAHYEALARRDLLCYKQQFELYERSLKL